MNDEEQPGTERLPVGASGRELVAESSHAGRPRANGHNAWHGPAAGLSITLPIGSSLFDVERAFIVATLEHFSGDKRRAASALGCSVKTLYNKLHLYRRQVGHDEAAD